MTRNCVCGHDRDAHRHFRRGSDCAMCLERLGCPRFRWNIFRLKGML